MHATKAELAAHARVAGQKGHAVKPLSETHRLLNYYNQNQTEKLTPKQARRLAKKSRKNKR